MDRDRVRAPAHATRAIAAAIAELRDLLPATRIVIGAMRPELCRLGGGFADGVLLNWMLPADTAQARRWVQEGAEARDDRLPVTALYVRVAVGAGSAQRLQDEESRYRRMDAAHFAAMDVPLGAVGVAASGRHEVIDALAPYRTLSTSRSRASSPAAISTR